MHFGTETALSAIFSILKRESKRTHYSSDVKIHSFQLWSVSIFSKYFCNTVTKFSLSDYQDRKQNADDTVYPTK